MRAVRDELRLLLCVSIVLNLPKFFDTETHISQDPCNHTHLIVLQRTNSLGA